MPVYNLKCLNDHIFDRFVALKYFNLPGHRSCDICGASSEIIIHAPLLVTVKPDIAYDSPIDGTVITSWAQRKDDLKRSGSIPFDPCMKQDQERRIAALDADMDRRLERTAEELVEKLPTKKRGELYSELTEQGKDIAVERRTVT